MIKCSHLTPKSIYSNIGDLVADPILVEVLHLLFLPCVFLFIFFLCVLENFL